MILFFSSAGSSSDRIVSSQGAPSQLQSCSSILLSSHQKWLLVLEVIKSVEEAFIRWIFTIPKLSEKSASEKGKLWEDLLFSEIVL